LRSAHNALGSFPTIFFVEDALLILIILVDANFFSLFAFSVVVFVRIAFFFLEVVFLLQCPIHRLRRHLFFIIPILSPSSLSSSFSPPSYIILLHSRVLQHYSDYISTIFGTILSSLFGLNQTHYFTDSLTSITHPSLLNHLY
jgi:hypothetical protein